MDCVVILAYAIEGRGQLVLSPDCWVNVACRGRTWSVGVVSELLDYFGDRHPKELTVIYRIPEQPSVSG